MRTLRYLLMMMIAVMGVLGVNAQTPKYGKTYKPEKQIIHQNVQAQLPEATMSSTGSDIMFTGSTLPQAAVTGTTMADETVVKHGKIRRDVGGGGSTADDEDPDAPEEPFPVGDAMWPLLACALAYLILRVVRARKRTHA